MQVISMKYFTSIQFINPKNNITLPCKLLGMSEIGDKCLLLDVICYEVQLVSNNIDLLSDTIFVKINHELFPVSKIDVELHEDFSNIKIHYL